MKSALTARTQGRALVEVCLAVLWQLGAELFRWTLPKTELELNKSLVKRSINDILGEIAWHVSALASVYKLNLSQIAESNIEKVSLRYDKSLTTPLHDEGRSPSEKFPRQFEVSIVSIGDRRSRMYLNGHQLGDDLTDNSYEEDGYRYHDIMHLANVAKLGWSPVLRGLMGLKRKSDTNIDEVEDGARAKIIEEAVIKSIHSEGARIAKLWGPVPPGASGLFSKGTDITFGFLKFIRSLVIDLEVHKNRYWEWEDAILEGHEIFRKLREEGQGTITVDLEARSITFHPEVCINLVGKVAGLGSAYINRYKLFSEHGIQSLTIDDNNQAVNQLKILRLAAQKFAVLVSLGNENPSDEELGEVHIIELPGKGISVKASGGARQAIWNLKVVAFKTTILMTEAGGCYCTVIAIADD